MQTARIIYPLKGRRVFVSGHRGMVGSALIRRIRAEECLILTATREELDLRDQKAVGDWFLTNLPDTVFVAAAHVGGIYENATHPGEFLYDNLAIAANIIEAARRTAVRKLMFLGSSCIYPRLAAQPIRESCLLTGPLEPTNEWYAIAKIAGLKLCQAYRRQYGCDFISAMRFHRICKVSLPQRAHSRHQRAQRTSKRVRDQEHQQTSRQHRCQPQPQQQLVQTAQE